MSSRDEMSTPDGEVPPTQAIIEAIAAHKGIDVTEVEPPAYDPLFTVVNPEALNALFHTTAGTASNVVVRLEYEGYEVVVRPGSDVDVRDSSSTDSVNGPIGE
ncbi:HalOD1 output domain-containing protein [Natrinema sp. SYSU A 869]|uniref:HalOD1 output domain-containing protein n=1 Tax=Natrinema sp. SYSU A 869 TaxID=2871694 RepID=UPI001CA3DDB6|nr:HalOD1 output domain-containing protein [Natrinema sp. SYSU A 869]